MKKASLLPLFDFMEIGVTWTFDFQCKCEQGISNQLTKKFVSEKKKASFDLWGK